MALFLNCPVCKGAGCHRCKHSAPPTAAVDRRVIPRLTIVASVVDVAKLPDSLPVHCNAALSFVHPALLVSTALGLLALFLTTLGCRLLGLHGLLPRLSALRARDRNVGVSSELAVARLRVCVPTGALAQLQRKNTPRFPLGYGLLARSFQHLDGIRRLRRTALTLNVVASSKKSGD